MSNCYNLYTLSNSVFSNCKKLNSVILPPNLVTLGSGCFSSTDSLTYIEIPDSVETLKGWTELDGRMFGSYLETVMIGENSHMKNIGNDVFLATSLNTLYIPQNCSFSVASVLSGTPFESFTIHPLNTRYKIDGNVIYSGNNNDTLYYVSYARTGEFEVPSFVKIIGNHCFRIGKVNSIKIHSNVQTIKDYAFSATDIVEFHYNDIITSIWSNTFKECSKLESVYLNDKITKIEYRAFYQCPKLKNIVLPSSLKEIGEYAFFGCQSLESLVLPAGDLTIGSAAFKGCTKLVIDSSKNENIIIKDGMLLQQGKSKLTEYFGTDTDANITIPSECSFIGDLTFKGTSIHSITFVSSSNVSVGKGAFQQSSIRNITFKSGLSSLGSNCFDGCSNLISVSISDSLLTEIPDYCFSGCSNLRDISLPSCISRIGEYAFNCCSSIGSIGLEYTSVISIGDKGFYQSGLSCANIPNTIEILGTSCFEGSSISSVFVSCDIPKFCFRGCSSLVSATLSSGVSTIYENSFESCIRLTTVLIPSSINLIRGFAFQNCYSLHNVSLSANSSLSGIYGGAFVGCTSLTEIHLEDSERKFRFSNGALITYAEDSLITFIPYSPITTFVVPTKMVSINNYAFAECKNLRRVLFNGNSLESISINAFSGCSRLEFLFFASSSLQSIGDGAFDGCYSLKRCGSISCPPDVQTRCFGKFKFSSIVFAQLCSDIYVKSCYCTAYHISNILSLFLYGFKGYCIVSVKSAEFNGKFRGNVKLFFEII